MLSSRLRGIISLALWLRGLESKLRRLHFIRLRLSRVRNTPCGSSLPSMDSFICSTALLIRGRGSSVGVAISLLCGATADQAGSSQTDTFPRRNVCPIILDTLVDQDDRGILPPAMATSWEPEPGHQRWHFYLRPGISFHDGTAVNSDSVAVSLRSSDPNWKVSPTGDSVVIECASPDPWLPAELALARNGIAKREGGKLLGSGTFAISHWNPGKKLELSARDDCWRGRAFVDSIEIEMGRNFREQMIELD